MVKAMKSGAMESRRRWVPEQAVSQMAQELAEKYNEKLAGVGIATHLSFATPIVTRVKCGFFLFFRTNAFHTCFAYVQVQKSVGEIEVGQYILVEKFLPGVFEKFNSNGGYEDSSHPVVTAFSHFTHTQTKGDVMVCDLQGKCLMI